LSQLEKIKFDMTKSGEDHPLAELKA